MEKRNIALKNRKKAAISALLLAAALLAAAFVCFPAAAEAGTKTTVIRTEDDDTFATETAKLSKQHPGRTASGSTEAVPYSSARLIVRVKDGSRVSFSKYKAVTVVESSYGVSMVQFASEKAAKKAASSLKKLSAVSYVEPDDCSINTGSNRYTIEEEENSQTGSGNSSGGNGGLEEIPGSSRKGSDSMFESTVKTTAASVSSTARMSWGSTYMRADKYSAIVKKATKRSIKVAVVDTGVSRHTRLNGRLLVGKDFVDNDNDASDKNGHGTHVAGIIVDCTPNLNVKILPVRALNARGVGTISTVGNAIRYAVNKGAKVINLSLGGYSHYKYLEECIAYANKKGVTVVVAAGNENMNTRYICPAHLSSPIVAGAINKKGKRAFFSNFGASLDVVAPGVGIRSCWLNGGYATADGTSMAAPHVSAIAAMHRIVHPNYSPAKIENLVKKYTKDLGTKGRDNYYGSGVPYMPNKKK